ncbi:putative regulatory protein, FmdB family [Thermostaphylospora chromogena]|uniref:Putative regulatory protein, FmdB family n=1 Tax=Thermostaphylospora chromogena TaxID=35622 RepID=A0A1H1BDR0_9ACTN|nr:FmdB family zinc ribbon protein [Thermostaphylospora chromogena]SDQ50065.1 putative regulatory protein, FmdB family [Thermostaphylospora chromogena]
MPTYQYACTACDEQLEVVQKFTDDALTECPSCKGRLRKVFSAVGIVFKGSGFYRTDSRSSNGSSSGSSSKSSSNGSSSSGSESGKSDSSTSSSSSSGSSSSSSTAAASSS